MFNINNIKKIEEKIQKAIDDVVNEHLPELEEAIKKEIPENSKIHYGGGYMFIFDEHGNDIDGAEEFKDYVTDFQYSKRFVVNTPISVK